MLPHAQRRHATPDLAGGLSSTLCLLCLLRLLCLLQVLCVLAAVISYYCEYRVPHQEPGASCSVLVIYYFAACICTCTHQAWGY